MVEPNNTSHITSNYVLSSTIPNSGVESEVAGNHAAGGRRSSRNRRVLPTITSLIGNSHVIRELSDAYSESSNACPTDRKVCADHGNMFSKPKNRPVFKFNALCVQVLLYPITVVIYLLIGAAVFTAIERNHEQMTRSVNNNNNMPSIDELQQAVETVLRKHNLSENASKEILFAYMCADHSSAQNPPHQWDFLPSFYFAATEGSETTRKSRRSCWKSLRNLEIRNLSSLKYSRDFP